MKFFAKNDEILKLARGKSVLHIGCVGFADQSNEQRIALAQQSLHFALTKEADTVGIDYCHEAIAYFREHGVFDNVYFANAEDLGNAEIPRKNFDVVIAGDIIEHLSCPGLFLDGLRAIMDGDSLLVVTTPNAFGLASFIRYFSGRFREGLEHVATYNSQNIAQLLVRHGFAVTSIDTCYQEHARTSGAVFHIGKMVLGAMPHFGGTLFVTARLR